MTIIGFVMKMYSYWLLTTVYCLLSTSPFPLSPPPMYDSAPDVSAGAAASPVFEPPRNLLTVFSYIYNGQRRGRRLGGSQRFLGAGRGV